jgi:hypothetical protein
MDWCMAFLYLLFVQCPMYKGQAQKVPKLTIIFVIIIVYKLFFCSTVLVLVSCVVHLFERKLFMCKFFPFQLLPDRRGGRPESSLSLRSHGGGSPPLLAPGRVTSPRHILGV